MHWAELLYIVKWNKWYILPAKDSCESCGSLTMKGWEPRGSFCFGGNVYIQSPTQDWVVFQSLTQLFGTEKAFLGTDSVL